MQIFATCITYVHILAGSTALVSGLLPICVRKGSTLHRKSGAVYYSSMALIAATSTTMLIVKPITDGLLFLAFIGAFSFYLTFSGKRSFQMARLSLQHPKAVIPNAAARLILLMGLLMGFLAIYYGFKAISHSANRQANLIFTALYGAFSWFSIGLGKEHFKKQTITDSRQRKTDAYLVHIARMIAAYIATVTAFCVINLSKLMPPGATVFLFILPGAIGAALISISLARYKNKLNLRQKD